ncbi:MAG: hypothetical protein H0X39_11570 [Actinobacteria bacterium]|nr:hypothetical protein [Actinomycetota bacterium]
MTVTVAFGWNPESVPVTEPETTASEPTWIVTVAGEAVAANVSPTIPTAANANSLASCGLPQEIFILDPFFRLTDAHRTVWQAPGSPESGILADRKHCFAEQKLLKTR